MSMLQFKASRSWVIFLPGAASDVAPAHPAGAQQEAAPASPPPPAAAQDGRGGRGQAAH